MAFWMKSSPLVVLVLMILLGTPPANSMRMKLSPGPLCRLKCLMKCSPGMMKSTFNACFGVCLYAFCGHRKRKFSDPSSSCDVSCVKSKCYNPGAGNGNVRVECASSCVNDCDTKFVGDDRY